MGVREREIQNFFIIYREYGIQYYRGKELVISNELFMTERKINFNPKQPMSKGSWKIWNEYGNVNHKEHYCHKTGKPSNGKTSMRNPIL